MVRIIGFPIPLALFVLRIRQRLMIENLLNKRIHRCVVLIRPVYCVVDFSLHQYLTHDSEPQTQRARQQDGQVVQ